MSSYKEKVCEVVSDAICGAAPHQRPGKSIWAASLSRYGSKEIGYSPQGELAAWADAWQYIDHTRAEALADLDKTIDELIDAEDELRAEAERPKVEWKLIPDEQAWWWHWNGEDYAVPHVYSVLVSNTGRPRYFVSFPDCRWCDEMGGFWLKVQYPNVPSREDQTELKARLQK